MIGKTDIHFKLGVVIWNEWRSVCSSLKVKTHNNSLRVTLRAPQFGR